MSEKWVVVTKNKKERYPSKSKIPISEENSKSTENLAKKQISAKGNVAAPPNFADADGDEKEKTVNKENQNKKTNLKKQNLQKENNVSEKPAEVKKPKPPKTLEQCLALIDVNDLIRVHVANFGGNSVSRLLDVVRVLNSKIIADQHDETYSTQPLKYPLSTVPPPIKDVLERYIKETSTGSIQVFLDLCLSSIANYMSKGCLATGYKIAIQLISEVNPQVFLKCITKVNSLMVSYQNRSPIGISLLWAAGQGGLHDTKVGLEVWKHLMLPRIDMRHYVKFVVMYLINLLKSHVTNKNESNKLNNDQVMNLIDFLNTRRKGMPKELEGLLNNQASVLRKLYFEEGDTWIESNMLERLLERLPTVYNGRKQMNDLTTKEIVYCFVEGLRKKDANINLWKDIHHSYIVQTAYILIFLENNWSTVYPTLNQKKLNNALQHFKGVYADLLKKNPNDESYKVSHQICQKLTQKVTKSRSWFWIFGSILLLPIISSLLIVYDVQRNGSFEKSSTGQFLDSMGVLEQTQYAWYKSLSYSARGYIWVENNAPYYYTATVDFSKPYWELSKDMALIVSGQACQLYGNVRDYAVEKWPYVQATVDEYVPGFLSTVQQYSATGWNAAKGFSVSCYNTTSTYLVTRVFVDNWAPEVLQQKTIQAFNSTQLYASQYYSWFHQQVDDYSKLQ